MPGDRGSQDLLVLVRVHTVPGAKSNGIMLVEEYDFNRNSCIEGPWRGGSTLGQRAMILDLTLMA